MAWKKPKWLSKAQSAVKIENKPAILQKVQNVAQSAANSTGNFIKSLAEPYQDRAPKVKTVAENPTGLTGTKTGPQAFDPIDAQVSMGKAMTSANRASNSAFVQKGLAQDRQDAQNTLGSSSFIPVVQRISDSLTTASGGSGTTPLPPQAPGAGEDIVTPGAGRPPPQRADTNYQRFASGGAAVQAIPVPAPDVADVMPAGPSGGTPIGGVPATRLTGEQQAPQRTGGSRLSRMLKRIPKRSMSM